jgi:hypothetical protein
MKTLLTVLAALIICGCASSHHHSSSYASYYPPSVPKMGLATDQVTSIHLTWSGSSKYYQIERAAKYSNGEDYDQFITVHTVTDGEQFWNDTGAPTHILVKYRVRASADDYLWTDSSDESVPVAMDGSSK